ncbi:hypothetical protein D9M71_547490 [compost metagenome]
MPTRKRMQMMPNAELCTPINTVETVYQINAKVKIARRPKRSAKGLNRLAPRNRPRNVAEAKAA